MTPDKRASGFVQPERPSVGPDPGLTLDEYQARALRTDILPQQVGGTDDAFVLPLLGLVGEIGGLATELKKRRRDEQGYCGFDDELREELGDALWYLAVLADRAGVSLSELALDNLAKATEAFGPPPLKRHQPTYDVDRPPSEQLPRRLTVLFEEILVERNGERFPSVTVRVLDGDGAAVGDPLDDNSSHEDDYRYHDVFHLAHMAVLGWSPVLRATLRPKRKRRGTRQDRIEDGGRAIAIEEGLTATVFSEAKAHSYFASADRVPGDLLKLCRRATAALEVSDRSAGDWQRAILLGYGAFAQLRGNKGGVVIADQDAGTLQYRPA